MNMKDGGPAFPRPASEYTASGTLADGNDAVRQQDGMSLRDYFAAKAMVEACHLENEYPTGLHGESTYAGVATRAYLMADAMLAARDKTP